MKSVNMYTGLDLPRCKQFIVSHNNFYNWHRKCFYQL